MSLSAVCFIRRESSPVGSSSSHEVASLAWVSLPLVNRERNHCARAENKRIGNGDICTYICNLARTEYVECE